MQSFQQPSDQFTHFQAIIAIELNSLLEPFTSADNYPLTGSSNAERYWWDQEVANYIYYLSQQYLKQ